MYWRKYGGEKIRSLGTREKGCRFRETSRQGEDLQRIVFGPHRMKPVEYMIGVHRARKVVAGGAGAETDVAEAPPPWEGVAPPREVTDE